MSNPNVDIRKVICAACRKGDTVLAGVRHFDMIMHSQIKAIGKPRGFFVAAEQGFLDQRGEFLTREEAFDVAKEAGQLEGRVKTDRESSTTLYSEDLY